MFCIAVFGLAASLPVIDSIRIEARWGGLGQPSATTYTIVRRGDHFRRRFAAVPQDAVDRFVAAITAPPLAKKEALRSLATPEWLLGRASEPHHDAAVPVCSPEAKRLLQQHLANPEEALKALNRYFAARWTDDNPFMSVDVTFHDRKTIHLESRAQPALMLPWKVGNVETWNPEISRAIAGLLPEGAEPRLTDRRLATAYVEEVVQNMRDKIDDIEERCVHRNFLAAVEKQFAVVRVYHGSPGSFTAYVRRTDFPANLVLTLVIRDDERPDAQAKLERTVQRTKRYVDVVRGYIAKYPKKYFAIWCVDGVSVEANERAVSLSEYDPASGIVSNPRIILPNGSVIEDRP
ncbi:MAG TPA: hypothetical protein VGQ46_20440 [Thermoanaerobaculia bacterium]|jgi:hypothetical protein|nr:hypothetical protein [Thermoanaerobaculia bacterium]